MKVGVGGLSCELNIWMTGKLMEILLALKNKDGRISSCQYPIQSDPDPGAGSL